MKRLNLLTVFLVCTMFTNAQNYETLHVVNIDWNDIYTYCESSVDGVIVYGVDGCSQNRFQINNPPSIWCDSIIVTNEYADPDGYVLIDFFGCGNDVSFVIEFTTSSIQNPFPEPFLWKRQGEAVSLEAYGGSVLWSTGETANEIEVSEPGIYSVTITDVCGSETFSLEVRDNVELYRATIDLESNLNKTTWRVTPEQAEYINDVKIYRDGMFVGTASYENGYFLDAIGSDNAARNYKIMGFSIEGEDCPITSYEKGTIHTTYYQDVNNNLNMTWNIPYVEEGAQGTLTYFQICKYDPNTGEITVVDQVNSLITDYTCGLNQFEGGYPVIAAVFSDAKDRDYEDRSFSNIGTNILVQPQEISISLLPGWTWISYTEAEVLDIPTALGDFMPMNGDMIKSQHGNAAYIDGQWRGSLMYFNPGWGYKYYSTRSEPATLIFGGSRRIRK